MLDPQIERAFARQARRAGWRLVCLKGQGGLRGFLMRAPDGAVGLYHVGDDDGREALHGDANPPSPKTITEGWRVNYYSGGNFYCCYTV